MVHACGPMEGLASRSQRLGCMAGTVQLGLHRPSGAAMAVAVPKCSYTCPVLTQMRCNSPRSPTSRRLGVCTSTRAGSGTPAARSAASSRGAFLQQECRACNHATFSITRCCAEQPGCCTCPGCACCGLHVLLIPSTHSKLTGSAPRKSGAQPFGRWGRKPASPSNCMGQWCKAAVHRLAGALKWPVAWIAIRV